MDKCYKLLLALVIIVMAMPGCKKPADVIPQGLTAKINNTSFVATTYKAEKENFIRTIGAAHYDDSTFAISGSASDASIGFSIPLPVMLGTYNLYPNTLNSQCSGVYMQSVYLYDPSETGTLTITAITENNIQGQFSFKTVQSNSITDGEFNIPIMY